MSDRVLPKNAEHLTRPYTWKDLPTKHFLVVGLARNCGNTIKQDVLKLHSAVRPIQNLHWLIIESDSNDDTIAKLTELELEIKQFRFISLGALQKGMPLRTERIAYCRNKYLEELRHNSSYRDVDYVIVADLDGINKFITEQAFLSCWSKDGWDVCTANQRGPYSDIWALRHKIWSPNDCWSQYSFLVEHNLPSEEASFAAVYSKMISIAENSDWIEVDSAFGGLAVYRRDALDDAEYVGLDELGNQLCEHVTFHSILKSKGRRIFINPKLINTNSTEHTLRLQTGLLSRLKRNLKGIINRG